MFSIILHNPLNKEYVPIKRLEDIPLKKPTPFKVAAVISELIEGSTLHEALTKPDLGRECSLIPGWRLACNVGRQLVKALLCCHDSKIIYRDLKPENVLVVDTDNNEPDHPDIKLIDFGHAKKIASLGRTKSICGSPLYFAPEIIQDANTDRRLRKGHEYSIDLWGLGIMLVVLLTGQDLKLLCHKPEDDEFIELNQTTGTLTPESYMYSMGFARMDETEKRKYCLMPCLQKEIVFLK